MQPIFIKNGNVLSTCRWWWWWWFAFMVHLSFSMAHRAIYSPPKKGESSACVVRKRVDTYTLCHSCIPRLGAGDPVPMYRNESTPRPIRREMRLSVTAGWWNCYVGSLLCRMYRVYVYIYTGASSIWACSTFLSLSCRESLWSVVRFQLTRLGWRVAPLGSGQTRLLETVIGRCWWTVVHECTVAAMARSRSTGGYKRWHNTRSAAQPVHSRKTENCLFCAFEKVHCHQVPWSRELGSTALWLGGREAMAEPTRDNSDDRSVEIYHHFTKCEWRGKILTLLGVGTLLVGCWRFGCDRSLVLAGGDILKAFSTLVWLEWCPEWVPFFPLCVVSEVSARTVGVKAMQQLGRMADLRVQSGSSVVLW